MGYNETLALRKSAWELEQKRISYFDSKKMIPIWKKDKPELKTVHSHSLQVSSSNCMVKSKLFMHDKYYRF
jgi:hypothetical protein